MSPTKEDRDRNRGEERYRGRLHDGTPTEDVERQKMSHRKQVIQTFLTVVIIAILVVLFILFFKSGLPNEQLYSLLG